MPPFADCVWPGDGSLSCCSRPGALRRRVCLIGRGSRLPSRGACRRGPWRGGGRRAALSRSGARHGHTPERHSDHSDPERSTRGSALRSRKLITPFRATGFHLSRDGSGSAADGERAGDVLAQAILPVPPRPMHEDDRTRQPRRVPNTMSSHDGTAGRPLRLAGRACAASAAGRTSPVSSFSTF